MLGSAFLVVISVCGMIILHTPSVIHTLRRRVLNAIRSVQYKLLAALVCRLAVETGDDRVAREKEVVFRRLEEHAASTSGPFRVLELRARQGSNLRFYPKGTRLTVVERHRFFQAGFQARVRSLTPGNVALSRYIVSPDNRLTEIPDGSFDAVLCSHALSWSQDPVETLREIKRVLIPGKGKLYFFEHTEDRPGTLRNWVQGLISMAKVWEWATHGERLDRRVNELVMGTGFRSVDFEKFYIALPTSYAWDDLLRKLTLSHIRGVAQA